MESEQSSGEGSQPTLDKKGWILDSFMHERLIVVFAFIAYMIYRGVIV